MKTTEGRKYNFGVLAVVIPAVIIVLPFAYSVGAWALSLSADDEPFLERPDERFEECVRDTDYMRFSHMTLLLETRDGIRIGDRNDIGLSKLKTEHAAQAVRTGDETRSYCSDCHTSREQYCDQCHTSVNLNLDCFSCHEYQ